YNNRSYIVKNYIMWQVVSKYVHSMPDEFVKAKLRFDEAVAGKLEYQRWTACVQILMVSMDMTMARMFVDAHFDENTKSTVRDMTTRVRKSFLNNLNSQDWMDKNTKDAAREKAYKSWVSDHEKEGQLPDLNLSVDQLFFIGFATPWCSVYKKEAALFQLRTDEHTYDKYRVIGSLSNFERFSKAFSCSSSKEMNRGEDRCAVW
ncbi:unnamed protein product, partial [Porites evermanni]